ncbi:T9SS C-terminal target domain-containing protein [Marinilabiliaceae bacterium JC017]|nr:T9SS C-terminal target domain-containing protein [Marinilabiliaceae bacterium JC017]
MRNEKLKDIDNFTVKKLNTQGQLIHKTQQESNLIKIDLSDFNKGLYIMTIDSPTKIFRTKFQKL